MSYILEALKKSQQERSRGKVPDIQTLHQSVSSAEVAAPRWPYWALGVCLLVMAFMLGWLQPWASRNEVAPVVVAEPVHDRKPDRATEAMPDKKVTPPSVVTPVEAVADVPSPAANVKSVEQVTDISQLPSLMQQSIPQMQFAGHVYSDNPAQRSVIINGRYMSEGDTLMQGMTLVRITLDSVVFSYQAQLFKVTVLHDWSFK